MLDSNTLAAKPRVRHRVRSGSHLASSTGIDPNRAVDIG